MAITISGSAHAATFFDAIYTVSSNGSTDSVTDFNIDGPAPWLYVDLLGPLGQSSNDLGPFITAGWVPNGAADYAFFQFVDSANGDKFWLAPTLTEWDSKKALGDWHIDSFLTNFVGTFAENGGIGVGNFFTTQGDTVNFTVTPEPASMALFGLGAGALGLTRLRRKKR